MLRLSLGIAILALALPACAQNPVTDAVKAAYGRVRLNFVETAEVVPESGYGFKLTPAQRPFGEWISHTALLAYTNCATMQGVPVPEVARSFHDLTRKADLTKALKDSLDYCDAAFAAMTDKKAAAEIDYAGKKVTPITPMVNLVGSLNEHYGNLVGYMRTQGIVPPSTARTAKK